MRIGLTFSGGGQKGIAHLGVVKGLEEDKIQIACLSGTSVGAIVASLYATNQSFEKLNTVLNSLKPQDVLDFNLWPLLRLKLLIALKVLDLQSTIYWGAFAGEKIRKILNKHLLQVKINELDIPIALTAVDLYSGQDVIFTNRKKKISDLAAIVIDDIYLVDAVRASMAIPFIYTGVLWDKYYFIDGGLTNNVPTNLLKFLGCKRMMAVDVSESPPYLNKPENILDMGGRLLNIAIDNTKYYTLPDVLLKPQVSGISLGDFSSNEQLIQQGYKEYQNKKK